MTVFLCCSSRKFDPSADILQIGKDCHSEICVISHLEKQAKLARPIISQAKMPSSISNAGADPGFPVGWAATLKGLGANIRFCQIFQKNRKKPKN